MNVSIIGLGLIGGSVAKDLRKTHFATHLVGVEASEANAREALEIGLVDEIRPLDEALTDADLVVLAIPVNHIRELLPQILDRIAPGTTVTDLGSTKRLIAAAVEQHPKRRNYVGSHPMSGTENSGPSAALEGLFSGKITIICDHEKSGPQHLALVEKMYQSMGSNLAYMSSDEQDHSTAYISHLPHVVAYALANAAMAKENGHIIFDLASGGFNSTVRLAKSAPSMWGPIFTDNKTYIIEALETYIKHLKVFRHAIEHDEKQMYQLMENATKIREVLAGANPSLIKNEEKIIKLYTK